MTNLTPTPGWDSVPQLEETTVAIGGPGGIMNAQAQALLNRTEQLNAADATMLAAAKAYSDANNARVVTTRAALKALDTTKYTNAFVTGYYASGDGGGIGPVWFNAGSTATDNGGTVCTPNSGAGAWLACAPEKANSKWFGAKGDKTTDDTAALQAYINYCLAQTLALPMVISGMCLVTASLNIDRLVDSTVSEFHIIAAGTESGFYANSAINIFDSTLPMTGVDPQSEFVTFSGVRFEAGPSGVGAYTLTRKFLRMKFRNCYWHKIRLIASDTYLQSFYFDMCNMRRWPGVWCAASHAFDTHFVAPIAEFGGDYLTFFPNGSYSLTFRDGCCEGGGGGLVSGGAFRQLTIDGVYMEQNAKPNVDMTYGGTNYNVSVKNCIMMATAANVADANFYDVVWGPTVNASAGGNNHLNGRLHNNGGLAAGGLLRGAMGDTAALSVVKDQTRADGGHNDFTLACTLGGGTLNYARFTRTENLVRVEFSFTFPTAASGSPAALYDLPIAAADAVISGIVDSSDYSAGPIRIIGGTGFAASNSATKLAFASDAAGTSLSYTALSGKTVAGQITYRV